MRDMRIRAETGSEGPGSASDRALGRLVRIARGPISQETFAAKLGISQESLSRYERGRTTPPSAVIAKCWETFEERHTSGPPAAEELAKRVHRVKGAEHVAVREVIARLIEISVARRRPGRPPRRR